MDTFSIENLFEALKLQHQDRLRIENAGGAQYTGSKLEDMTLRALNGLSREDPKEWPVNRLSEWMMPPITHIDHHPDTLKPAFGGDWKAERTEYVNPNKSQFTRMEVFIKPHGTNDYMKVAGTDEVGDK